MAKKTAKRAKGAAGSTRRVGPTAEQAAAAEDYRHPTASSPLRPDVGVQPQFKKKKPPKAYRYDSSLSPSLEWDGEDGAREHGEALIAQILSAKDLDSAKGAAARLKAMSAPFLNWAGKAEHGAFDVPTLPLFVHERLSTRAILETVQVHKRDKQVAMDLFGDPDRPLADQLLKAYEHRDKWVNRMLLGDSLVVMNSLLEYEGLGGQVQMIYIDPPYGVKFGSNFQPFVRKRDVKHGDDADLTREPEMVQAYRDTWELGLHSYLSYMRDRLKVARELLTPSGSVFVQISDENLHHVREVMDEVFGAENSVSVISFRKTSGASSPTAETNVLAGVSDYLLWYARDREVVKYRQLYFQKAISPGDLGAYTQLELSDGTRRPMSTSEREDLALIPLAARIYRTDNLTGQSGVEKTKFPVEFDGTTHRPAKGVWKTSEQGMKRLIALERVVLTGETLKYVRYLDDFPVIAFNNFWEDTVVAGFGDKKVYAVQTSAKVIQRCVHMTTDAGDLVLDPTCGSGTTAYVAEHWGRRWITCDVSRVPLALARQRLLTATFDYYDLQDESRGPAGGFVYKRRQNKKGEEVGGIVPHVTLKSIANDEPPAEEVLVDRPEVVNGVTRVAGPFTFEATIPTPVDYEGDGKEDSGAAPDHGDFVMRMVEVLRRSPLLRLPGNRTIKLEQVRQPAKSLSLSAEAMQDGAPVAFVFGPEHGAVSEKLVFNAANEARVKGFTHLYVVGFAIEPNARMLVEAGEAALGVGATWVEATPDLVLGDLLKTMRSSQVFSVTGLPEISLDKVDTPKGEEQRYAVSLLGLDTFDPATMETDHLRGDDVPAWFLDTDYDETRCFRVCQAFFPRTGAWDNLKRALRGEYDDSLWAHLGGTTSAPFVPGDKRQIAVKVIDVRGHELLVTRKLTA
jgi:adenine-specific DNA-methyltransferase